MPRKPPDPLKARFANNAVLEPYDWSSLIETSVGLPNVPMVWRPLRVGELMRAGDYIYAPGGWSLVESGRVIEPDGTIVHRPLGPDARTWYVGPCAVGDTPNGSHNHPFRSISSAKYAADGAIGLFISTEDLSVIDANDPPNWDWNAHLHGPEPAQSVDEQRVSDRLKALAATNISPLAQDRDGATGLGDA